MRERSEMLGTDAEVADIRNLLPIVMVSTSCYCDYSLTALGLGPPGPAGPPAPASWHDHRRRSGGDLSGPAAIAAFAGGLPPVLALDAAACAALAHGAAWEALLATSRVVHLSSLDPLEDDGIRVSQIITSLQYGGAERIALDLHHELLKQGTAAQLMVLGKPGRRPFPHPEDAVDLSHLPAAPQPLAMAIAGAAVRFGADLLHAHLLGAAHLQALTPHGLPVLLTLHNTSSGWPRDLPSLTPKDVRLLAACSLTVEADARRWLPALPVRTAWNGIDLAAFLPSAARTAAGQALRQSLNLSGGDLLVLTLANPRPQKRFDRLPPVIAALRTLAPRRTIRLLIAGEASFGNPEAAACIAATHAAATAAGVRDSLIWHGPSDDVPTLLAAADVLLSTSAHEGLSLAHLEALAMGLPVVALEAGGTTETALTAGDALTVLPQTASSHETAMAVLAASAGPDTREAVRRCFSQHAMARRYQQLYHRTLGAPMEPGRTIWLVTNNFATGGAQSSARRLLAWWHQQGIAVRAAVLQEEPADPTLGRTALEAAGIPVLVLPRLGPHHAAETIAALWPALDADPPRAVLFWNAVMSCKRLIADGLLHTPVFDISPGGMYFEALHPSFAHPRPDIPAAASRHYGQQLAGAVVKYARETAEAEAALGIPVTVIPNGVQLPAHPVPFRDSPAPFRFGTAARLHPQKRLDDLLASLRLARSGMPDCELHIAGGMDGEDPTYADCLKETARDLPVIWHDEITDSGTLAAFHASLDAFVMISEPAGCPNASLEALAAGLPVIATDFGGASEQVITGLTGLLVPPRDLPAFAAAMVQLATDPALRRACARGARRHLQENFSLPRMAHAFLALMDHA